MNTEQRAALEAQIRKSIPDTLEVVSLTPRAGYVIADLLVNGSPYGSPSFKVSSAFTPDGKYIGEPRMAYQLVKRFGIEPEYRTTDSTICTVGYSKRRGRWFGWSHRAIAGFRTRERAAAFAESVA